MNRQFTDSQIFEIRQRYARGDSNKCIANAYGTTSGTISCIVHGKTYTGAPGPIARRGRTLKRELRALTNKQALDALALLEKGERQADVARQFGVRADTIRDLANGRGYADIQIKRRSVGGEQLEITPDPSGREAQLNQRIAELLRENELLRRGIKPLEGDERTSFDSYVAAWAAHEASSRRLNASRAAIDVASLRKRGYLDDTGAPLMDADGGDLPK